MPTIQVHISSEEQSDQSYDILIGDGIIGQIGQTLKDNSVTRCLIISDASVDTHALNVIASIKDAGIECQALTIPSGESSKSLSQAEDLWEAMALHAVDRRTHIIAVGGGVTGDLVGFIAATFARGLPLWHIPTTLVAQVDSAIGGKTGINLDAGKNLVGCFWQPQGVFSDIQTLSTLPDREYRSGLAEVLKYGIILDEEFFGWLENHVAELLSRESSALMHAVTCSAALKAQVVEKDEREVTGLRAILNYGHTFAHAFEKAAGYGKLLHGEAVSIGMACAARLAHSLGRVGEDLVDRQNNLISQFQLPQSLPTLEASKDDLLTIMARDKKSLHGQLRFILPNRIGHVELIAHVDPNLVKSAMR